MIIRKEIIIIMNTTIKTIIDQFRGEDNIYLYDAPKNNSISESCYDNITSVIANYLSELLKDHPSYNQAEWIFRDRNSEVSDYYDNICGIFSKYKSAMETDEIGLEWIKVKGVYAGTLPKRIAKFYARNGIRLPNDLLGKIGSIANADLVSQSIYGLDIDFNFEWDPGDYGDEGSCYWGCRTDAKQLIRDSDGCAIRVYVKNDYNNWEGYGRCWALPINETDIVIFNAYPKNFKLIKLARMISTIIGYNYNEVSLSNNETKGGLLWINGSNHYVISPNNFDQDYPDTIDLHLSLHNCSSCGKSLDELDDYRCYSYEGESFCKTCFDETFCQCERCGETVYNDDAIYYDYIPYCDYCYDHLYTTCDYCGYTCYRDDIHYIDDDDLSYCGECFHHNFHECEECDNIYPIDKMIIDEYGTNCVNCHKMILEKLEVLGEN
jgi:hypothetical protein